MNFLFRLTGILASVATIILTVLDILDRHTDVDTQALLSDIGGGFGRAVASVQDWLGGIITWLAIKLSELISGEPTEAPASQMRCPPDRICPRSIEEAAPSTSYAFYEFGAQLAIVAIAILVLLLLSRRRA